MASKQARNRLTKELKGICADPPPHIHVSCDESNILNWSYLLEGPEDTPYEGGWYWGRLKFPKEYPFQPPSILMVTPSGRFETNVRLCLSMSDYHPESWQPAWSLATVLKGLLSFMCEETPTAGSIEPPTSQEHRRKLAAESMNFNQAQPDFMKAFPEASEIVAAAARRPRHRPVPSEVQPPADRRDRPNASDAGSAAAGELGASQPFPVGATVRIDGLKARTDLNGREGVVEESGDVKVAPGRVVVRVSDESISVKPENLSLVRGADGDAASPEACEAATAGSTDAA